MSRRRKLACDCGSTDWRHHEAFCPAVTGVPACLDCGEFHTGRCAETYTRCCDPALSVLDKPCATCPLGVRRVA